MARIIIWLIYAVPKIINAYTAILAIYALMTWLPNALSSKFGQLIRKLVEPYLSIFYRLIPSVGMVSFSVLFAILFLRLVEYGAHVVLVFLLRLVTQF
ncbi:YggT family protein [Jeotgalibaca ciconiae]|uniref:YggT family protein n=1 Tax=Jeotgalibaca ciconiae TaxID=2496265 RepID=A0A3S9HCK4_9LACT|nr:YggT family protein [Jeotgalibaca ciconiae]AZP05098.1 YggT family protein [Jeotgalibaca ciconiae]HJB23215.1 YggT family protein [Candidatus Jeotgalibaca pullicola]